MTNPSDGRRPPGLSRALRLLAGDVEWIDDPATTFGPARFVGGVREMVTGYNRWCLDDGTEVLASPFAGPHITLPDGRKFAVDPGSAPVLQRLPSVWPAMVTVLEASGLPAEGAAEHALGGFRARVTAVADGWQLSVEEVAVPVAWPIVVRAKAGTRLTMKAATVVAGLAPLLGLATLFGASANPARSLLERVAMACAGVAVGVAGLAFARALARRPRVEADAEGLTLYGLPLTERLRWDDIRGFETFTERRTVRGGNGIVAATSLHMRVQRRRGGEVTLPLGALEEPGIVVRLVSEGGADAAAPARIAAQLGRTPPPVPSRRPLVVAVLLLSALGAGLVAFAERRADTKALEDRVTALRNACDGEGAAAAGRVLLDRRDGDCLSRWYLVAAERLRDDVAAAAEHCRAAPDHRCADMESACAFVGELAAAEAMLARGAPAEAAAHVRALRSIDPVAFTVEIRALQAAGDAAGLADARARCAASPHPCKSKHCR